MTSRPLVELTWVWTGTTALTPSISRILSPKATGIVELLNASNNDEFGGWNRISAPTPSVRLPVSSEIPAVSPTTTRINVTSRVTARMLTVVRTGRAARPAMIIFLYMRNSKGPAFRAVIGFELYQFGAGRALQVKSFDGERVVNRRLLENHLQRIVVNGPLNQNDLRKGNVSLTRISRIFDVGIHFSIPPE